MVTTWQGGAARGVVGAGQGGVTVQGGLGIPSSQGFTTIHPVIESMETGEVPTAYLFLLSVAAKPLLDATPLSLLSNFLDFQVEQMDL